ncbi:MAG: hypothetical protein ACUVS5_11555 [Anaerolineae bacterium]
MSVPMFRLQGRELAFTDDARRVLDEAARALGASPDVNEHALFGERLYGPIDTLARYQEWGQFFFTQERANPNEVIRIIRDPYAVTAFEVSPSGEFYFNRPGYSYATIEWHTFRAGLEVTWRQLKFSGFSILERKMREVAEELARKRDALRKAALDAAVASISNHSVSVSGGVLTKAAVDSVLVDAMSNGYQLTIAAINSGRVVDMTGWTVSNVPLWQMLPDDLSRDMFQNLWVSGYGGVNWLASPSVPYNTVYLSAGPAETGWEWQSSGGVTHASDVDIRKGADYHVWEQDVAVHVENPYAVYRIVIS